MKVEEMSLRELLTEHRVGAACSGTQFQHERWVSAEVELLRRFGDARFEAWQEDGVFVSVAITDKHVELHVGGRAILWSRNTGRVTDTGFFVNPQGAETV